jgi:epsilon-lactone hydrolase
VISRQATRFWSEIKAAPHMIALRLSERRAAGEHAEDATTEPPGVRFAAAPEVGGLWSDPPEARPDTAILYLFGGGYVLGSPASRRKTAGHLALALRARILVPNYRLAPEHPFPAAVEDAVAAWQWLLATGSEPNRAVIAGDSASGVLALATAIACRDRRLPGPAGVVALSPWADLTCSGAIMTSQVGRDLECTREGLLEMAGWYLRGAAAAQPLASPVFADLAGLPPLLCLVGGEAGLPPLLCLVGGEEVLLDDAVRLTRSAGMAGVSATLYVGAGMQHVFPIWCGAFPEADAAMARIGAWVLARTGGTDPPRAA